MSSGTRARVAVLASGGGSNLGALLDHADRLGDARAFDVVLVGSDRAAAGALTRAAARAIPTAQLVVPGDADALLAQLDGARCDILVLAGYLKHVPEAVTRAYVGRIVNVHPSLLPAFGGPGMYGARVHRAVLDAGARVSGATVHLVDEAYDRGPIIAQWPVPVLAGDTPESLAARVLRVEHALLPRAVEGLATGRITLGPDGRVRALPGLTNAPFALADVASDAAFAFDIARAFAD